MSSAPIAEYNTHSTPSEDANGQMAGLPEGRQEDKAMELGGGSQVEAANGERVPQKDDKQAEMLLRGEATKVKQKVEQMMNADSARQSRRRAKQLRQYPALLGTDSTTMDTSAFSLLRSSPWDGCGSMDVDDSDAEDRYFVTGQLTRVEVFRRRCGDLGDFNDFQQIRNLAFKVPGFEAVWCDLRTAPLFDCLVVDVRDALGDDDNRLMVKTPDTFTDDVSLKDLAHVDQDSMLSISVHFMVEKWGDGDVTDLHVRQGKHVCFLLNATAEIVA